MTLAQPSNISRMRCERRLLQASLAAVLALSILLTFAGAASACGLILPEWKLQSQQGHILEGASTLTLRALGRVDLQSPPQVMLTPISGAGGTSAVTLSADSEGASGAVHVDLKEHRLLVGARYRLTVSSTANGSPLTTQLEFDVTARPAAPDSLGTIEVQRSLGLIAGRECVTTPPPEGVQAALKLAASTSAAPWFRGMQHFLSVDGRLVADGELPLITSSGNDWEPYVRAVAYCAVAQASTLSASHADNLYLELPVGKHTFVWKARMPSGEELSASPVEVDLSCTPATMSPQASPSVPPVPIGSPTALDAGERDASVSRGDAGSPLAMGTGRDAAAAIVASEERDDERAASTDARDDNDNDNEPTGSTGAADNHESRGCAVAGNARRSRDPWLFTSLLLSVAGLVRQRRR